MHLVPLFDFLSAAIPAGKFEVYELCNSALVTSCNRKYVIVNSVFSLKIIDLWKNRFPGSLLFGAA
jgi:hypothetical protein